MVFGECFVWSNVRSHNRCYCDGRAADQLGLSYVRDRLAAFATQTGNKSLEPAPLLTRLVGESKGFAAFSTTKTAA